MRNCLSFIPWLLFAVVSIGTPWAWGDTATPRFIRGDTTGNRSVSLSDAINLLGFLFLDDRGNLDCMDAADTNDDGNVGLADVLYLLFFLFDVAQAPPAPFPVCGPDETEDSLDCEESIVCGTPQVLKNSVGMELLLFMPPGSFMMGSPVSERGRNFLNTDETLHGVTLTCGFYMGKTEVTQGQYKAVMGVNPSYYQGPIWGDDLDRPVEHISWFDAEKFCAGLSLAEGVVYRLPTEAEWEYACRAGTTTRFWFGDALQCDDFCSECVTVDACMWWCGNAQVSQRVGQKKPNPWGLHDMHGNLTEWCQDWYGAYPNMDLLDPRGPATGTSRVLRGSGDNALRAGRSATRLYSPPKENLGSNLTFRIVRDICSSGVTP